MTKFSQRQKGFLWNGLSVQEKKELLLADDESNNVKNLISNKRMMKKYRILVKKTTRNIS